MKYTLDFDEINMEDLPEVGGKNASLGEMFRNLTSKGINVPDGFALTTKAYNEFLDKNKVRAELESTLSKLDKDQHSNLAEIGEKRVKKTISSVIRSAKQTNTKIGLCGQAPSDFPEYAQFLVNEGIDSISFSPDALLKGIENINIAEEKKNRQVLIPLSHKRAITGRF